MTYVLKLFNTGQVTLPKAWRDRIKTKNFIATEKDGGLFIQPIDTEKSDVTYYESSDGFGIFSEKGVDPESLITRIKKLQHG